MKRLMCGVLLALCGAAPALAQEKPGEWLVSWEQAAAAAKKRGLPVLIEFTASDRFKSCARLRTKVFAAKSFKDWAAKSVVLLAIDFPKQAPELKLRSRNEALLRKYLVHSFPTVVFVDVAGKELGRMLGPVRMGAGEWVKKAQAVLIAAKKAASSKKPKEKPGAAAPEKKPGAAAPGKKPGAAVPGKKPGAAAPAGKKPKAAKPDKPRGK